MTSEDITKQRFAILSVEDFECAFLQVNGLMVLERNIKSLQKIGFVVFVDSSKENSEIDDLVKKLHISKYNEEDTQSKNRLIIRGDEQYNLSFFQELNVFFSNKPKQNHVFFDQNNHEIPVRYLHSLANTEVNISLKKAECTFVTHLSKELSRKKLIKFLEKKQFEEIYENAEGWVAKGINKKISFPLTRLFVKTNISPNQITFICLIMGLLGCFSLLSKSWQVRCMGALALQLSSILDGCDGEVARLKVITSRIGAWFDTIADDILNNVMLLCLYLGFFFEFHNLWVLQYGVATSILSLGVSFFLYHFMITHNTPNAAHYRLSWEKQELNIEKPKGKTVFDYVKPLLKRDFFIFVAMLLIFLDLRLVLIALFGSVWIAFFLYLASFVYGLLKKESLR